MSKSKSNGRPLWNRVFLGPLTSLKLRIDGLLLRRPHRSFHLTRRRDYTRSLELPRYWAFTGQVFQTIWSGRRQLMLAAGLYAVVSGLVVGLASQQVYYETAELLQDTGGQLVEGGIGPVAEAGLLLVSTVIGNLTGAITPESQAYSGLLGILFWLLVVWLLRNQLAGKKVKFRDGLYNSGAPLVSTFLVLTILILQMIPLAFAAIAYSAGAAGGLLSGGVEAMLIWLAIALLAILSLYWSVSTLIALVIVTLPGMYPMRAIKTAGDLVIGRRIRIFLRLLFMMFVVVVSWTVVMVPVIIIDSLIKSAWSAVEWVPAVPVLLLIMISLTLLFVATYIYLLYRRIVDDDAKPA